MSAERGSAEKNQQANNMSVRKSGVSQILTVPQVPVYWEVQRTEISLNTFHLSPLKMPMRPTLLVHSRLPPPPQHYHYHRHRYQQHHRAKQKADSPSFAFETEQLKTTHVSSCRGLVDSLCGLYRKQCWARGYNASPTSTHQHS